MTEIAAASPARSGHQRVASALIRKRYAAERRFRFYGIAAIAVTGLFVLVLLLDILVKGFPAFTEHRLVFKVQAEQAALDPQNSGDPAKIRMGDFDGIIREALWKQFPDVTARADRKRLNGLLSSGAADDFRSLVVADPALIGREIAVPVILSDDADQYLKGYQTSLTREEGKSDLTIAPDGDGFILTASAPEFRAVLANIKIFVEARLARDSRELDRLNRAMTDLERTVSIVGQRLDAASGSGDDAVSAAAAAERDRLMSELQSLAAIRDGVRARVDALKSRLAESGSAETLDVNLPSIVIEAAGGAFKVTELGAQSVRAEAVIPPSAMSAIAAGQWHLVEFSTPEGDRRTGDKEAIWLESLKSRGLVDSGFAWRFLTSGDSREPELAGIKGAFVGSLLTLAVTLIICLPLGVGAAVYLEEFAPKNRLTEIIEVNINNLAAVPSIVFGLLGLAVFLNFFGLPRSAPLVGGLVLALLVLPTIIIASRAALKAVPPSIKEAALGVGASHQQAIFHHVLPLAVPGIMTGTIIGMAHALGETAPLLMIGMVAFIVDVPEGFTEAATALPVQIYLWSDLPEVAFQAKTAAAIIVLLAFLFAMNALAIYVRKRFERRW